MTGAERASLLREAVRQAEAEADRLEAQGGPRRAERAREAREHARLWRLELDALEAE